jgi:hypothetical protein
MSKNSILRRNIIEERSNETINLFVTSNQCVSKNTSGNVLNFNIQPIDITGKKARLLNANIWYNTPNIQTSRNNNKIVFTYDVTTYEITLNDGLYSLDDINESISEFMTNNALPITLIYFNGDSSSGKITLNITTSINFTVNWTLSTLTKNMLGFNYTGIYTTNSNKSYDGNQIATLNVLSAYIVKCSFTSGINNILNNE